MYQIDMLPAAHGDCLWVTWGTAQDLHHMLIDGGPPGTGPTLRRRVEQALQAAGGRLHIDLLVVSHIDSDHIGGILSLLQALPAGVTFGDVWFNAYRHLRPPDLLGVVQGEKLTKLLAEKKLPHNLAFSGKAVVVPPTGPLPQIALTGGMTLTLLSPTPDKLARLAPTWADEARKAGLKAGAPAARRATDDFLGKKDKWPPNLADLENEKSDHDDSAANGSSIAFIAAFGGKSCLFAADAHADVLTASLKRLGAPVKLDAFKLPHHGAGANLSPELLTCVDCDRFLISTNGDIHKHPDFAAVARILKRESKTPPTLIFNYRSATTSVWEGLSKLPGAPAANLIFPTDDAGGAVIDLENNDG
jgi:beta-lactamase superfamily II metal-dependent hydrolase